MRAFYLISLAVACAAVAGCASDATTITPPLATTQAGDATPTRALATPTATPRPDILLPGAWQPPPATAALAPPPISAASAVVLDEASGAVLFDKGALARMKP